MYHVSHQGQQFGPYTVEQINEYLAQGVFDASSHVWDANANGWIEILKLPGVVLSAKPISTSTAPENLKEQCPHCGTNSVVKKDGLQGVEEIVAAVVCGLLCFLPAVIYYWLIERLPYCLQCNRRIAGYPAPVLTTMAAVILVTIMILLLL